MTTETAPTAAGGGVPVEGAGLDAVPPRHRGRRPLGGIGLVLPALTHIEAGLTALVVAWPPIAAPIPARP
jgi:hypothetical protein